MYLLRYIDNAMTPQESWDRVSDDEKTRIYRNFALHVPAASELCRQFPIVKFSYIKFDGNFIGRADIFRAGVVDNNLDMQNINWDDIGDLDDGDILSSASSRL